MVKDPKNWTDQSILMPVTMFTTTLVSHQNCQHWILGTKPSHHREGRCWHSVSATGHAALGWPTESGSLYWARYQARSAHGNGCSRCHSSQAESHQGETMWKVNFGATLLCLLFFMTVWNAFILAGDAECLLCDTQARWVQFCLWFFFFIWKNTKQSHKRKKQHMKKHNPCLLHLLCQGRNWAEIIPSFILLKSSSAWSSKQSAMIAISRKSHWSNPRLQLNWEHKRTKELVSPGVTIVLSTLSPCFICSNLLLSNCL